jgi:hypothetical protein
MTRFIQNYLYFDLKSSSYFYAFQIYSSEQIWLKKMKRQVPFSFVFQLYLNFLFFFFGLQRDAKAVYVKSINFNSKSNFILF